MFLKQSSTINSTISTIFINLLFLLILLFFIIRKDITVNRVGIMLFNNKTLQMNLYARTNKRNLKSNATVDGHLYTHTDTGVYQSGCIEAISKHDNRFTCQRACTRHNAYMYACTKMGNAYHALTRPQA